MYGHWLRIVLIQTLQVAFLADQSVWKKYAHNLVQYAYIYGFDGYNFDFENIDYADRDRLTAL